MPDSLANPLNKVESVKPKSRPLRKDALFFSGLVLDKRFNMSVRYVDWVDLNAAPSETFSGAYVLYGPIEIESDRPRVLLVKAAYGSISDRKPWVQIMVLQSTGFISKTKISADASVDGWELGIRDQVLRLFMRIKKAPAISQNTSVKDEQGTEMPVDHPIPLKAGDTFEVVCSKRLSDLHARMPDRSLQAIIDYALHQVSIDDYLDDQPNLP